MCHFGFFFYQASPTILSPHCSVLSPSFYYTGRLMWSVKCMITIFTSFFSMLNTILPRTKAWDLMSYFPLKQTIHSWQPVTVHFVMLFCNLCDQLNAWDICQYVPHNKRLWFRNIPTLLHCEHTKFFLNLFAMSLFLPIAGLINFISYRLLFQITCYWGIQKWIHILCLYFRDP